MSAYICDREHIRYLVSAAMSRWLNPSPGDRLAWYWGENNGQSAKLYAGDYKEAARVGQMLWDENVRSVSYRYPDDKPTELPGPCDDVPLYGDHVAWQGEVRPVQVLKSISCFEYQSCEHPEWKTSEAFAFCRALESAAIYALDGYDDAAWGAPEAVTV